MKIGTFEPDVVAAVCRHMNEDHAADCITIAQAFASAADVRGATMAGFDSTGVEFVVKTATASLNVVIPWPCEVRTRSDVRGAIVELHTAAFGLR